MDTSDSFNKLKALLEGKTISALEKGTGETICKFVLSDGSSFSLCATDLGYWTEAFSDAQGYSSLSDLIVDFDAHTYNMHPQYRVDMSHASVEVNNGIVNIVAPDDKVFSIPVSKLTDMEKTIVNDVDGRLLLGEAVYMGSAWTMLFNTRSDCPKHLCIK